MTPEELWERSGVRATACCQFGGTFRREKQRKAGIWECIEEKASRAVVKDDSRPE